MPNEPEQVSVNTTMTAVNRRILTRFRPWLRNISVIRPPNEFAHLLGERLRCQLPQVDAELDVLGAVYRNVHDHRAAAVEGLVEVEGLLAGDAEDVLDEELGGETRRVVGGHAGKDGLRPATHLSLIH